MYAAFNCTQRLVQHISNFVVFEPVIIQEKWVFKYFGQIIYCFVHFFHIQNAYCGISRGNLVKIEQEIVYGIIENGVLFGFFAVIIYKNITHDGI